MGPNDPEEINDMATFLDSVLRGEAEDTEEVQDEVSSKKIRR
jgi:hypothetical protein